MSNVVKISIPPGFDFFIDESDLPIFNAYKWRAYKHHNTYYAKAWVKISGGRKKFYFHRFILGLLDDKVNVDHKDGNGLNNSRSNIRPCTHSQNNKNMRMKPKFYTRYKGVFRNKSYCKKPFVAAIKYNGIYKHLGTFMTDTEAAEAYNQAASRYHGEFACLNEITV